MQNIIFCDRDSDFAKKIVVKPDINLFNFNADIGTVVGENMAFVFPVDSSLEFTDNIKKLFPRLQENVRSIMENYDSELSVGSALVIPLNSDRNQCVVTVPTKTDAYYPMLAALGVINKYNARRDEKILSLIVPALVEDLSSLEMSLQLEKAINNYFANKDVMDALPGDPNIYLSNRDL